MPITDWREMPEGLKGEAEIAQALKTKPAFAKEVKEAILKKIEARLKTGQRTPATELIKIRRELGVPSAFAMSPEALEKEAYARVKSAVPKTLDTTGLK